ncbi:MAG: ferredoxin [Saprospiraceae bacterium]|nr:ferredoxin [Saprospiraceae bacterium]
MVRIVFLRHRCIGCNACVEAAPDRWRVSRKDGRCNLVGGTEKQGIYRALVAVDEFDRNEEARQNCPVRAIQVETVR